MDLGGWLRSLGLEQYEAAFRENAIDDTVLPNLTAEDLKDLGVGLVGHRRKLLDAIAGLSADERAKTASPEVLVDKSPKDAAERRQVTVMFSDLVGSTALSARLDPEDLRELVSAYQKCVAETVRRFGGFVAKYMGDGVLAYFGYPDAQEDDAERAAESALALVPEVAKLSTHAPLQTRVGIATGLVVVGDLVGSGEAQERGIVGETPNLAARLQGLAEPDMVVIAESTRKLLGDLFELHDLGPRNLKGLAKPVRAWAALRRSSVESRFEALRSGRAPIIGRAEEFELLLRRWQQVQSGEGRGVVLTGEPGIGKSRIVVALQEHLQHEPHTRLRYFCSPRHKDTALYPLTSQLERAAGFTRHDTAEEKLNKLEAMLAQSNAPPEEIGLIVALLSIRIGRRYPLPELSPQKRKEKTLTALVAQLERLAARQPVLVVYEDVHWIDPTTLELLSLVIERVQHLPVLLLVTARPEFRPPWPASAHVTNIALGPISREEGATLIAQVTGGKTLPSEVLQQILAHTDGVPLFLEELTKTVVESGVLTDAGDRYAMAGPLPALVIPTSLNASLQARLDRLSPVREVAQIGAVLGRHFSHALISAVVAMPQRQLDDALAQLLRAELIFRRGTPPDAEYTFKHALVQDAAYGTLLRAQRQQLHGRIATTLERQFPEIAKEQPERMAQHCAEAGLVAKAVAYCLEAGELAVARGLMTEALAQLQKGLDLQADLPDGAVRHEQELDLQLLLGRALMAAKGYGAPELGETLARARQLSEQLDRPEQLAPVMCGQWVFRSVRGEFVPAERHAREVRHFAETRNDAAWKCFGQVISGDVSLWLGKFADARAYLERALSLWDPSYRALGPLPEDPYVHILKFLYRTLVCIGHLDQARMRRDEALVEARQISPYSLASMLRHVWYGDWAIGGVEPTQALRRFAEEVLAISSEHGFGLPFALGNMARGWSVGVTGQPAEGVSLIEQALNKLPQGANLGAPFHLMALAEVYGKAGRPLEGLRRLAEAAELVERTGERWAAAEMHRLGGVLLLSTDEDDAAEDSFNQALAIARQQDAKFWELRAATELARLWRDQGKSHQARELLAPVYGWFTEGFDTPALKEARELLNE